MERGSEAIGSGWLATVATADWVTDSTLRPTSIMERKTPNVEASATSRGRFLADEGVRAWPATGRLPSGPLPMDSLDRQRGGFCGRCDFVLPGIGQLRPLIGRWS